MPWIVVFWCFTHRLELALNDALANTCFPAIDELLLPIYYLYKKAPKKCRELDDVVTELSCGWSQVSCLQKVEIGYSKLVVPVLLRTRLHL